MKYTKEKLEEAAIKSNSIAQVIRYLGMTVCGGTYALIKRNLMKFEIDSSHFTGQAWHKGKRERRKNPEEYFIHRKDQSKRVNGKVLKSALVATGREYKCEKCGNNGRWMNNDLVLQLDHINGDLTDDRKENLMLLCPNCHSQTSTFCGKNVKTKPIKRKRHYCKCGKEKRKKSNVCKECRIIARKTFLSLKRPSKEHLIESLVELKSNVKLGKRYNVSDNTIRRWLNFYKIKKK